MAKIEVKDIKSNGAELFEDSEGFMDELNEDIFEEVKGGTLACVTSIPYPPRPYPPLPDPTLPFQPQTLPYTVVIL